jgi:hypothetical protein
MAGAPRGCVRVAVSSCHTLINCIPNGQSAWLSPAEIRHCREPFSRGISVWQLSSFGERDVKVGKPHLGLIERTHFVDERGVTGAHWTGQTHALISR